MGEVGKQLEQKQERKAEQSECPDVLILTVSSLCQSLRLPCSPRIHPRKNLDTLPFRRSALGKPNFSSLCEECSAGPDRASERGSSTPQQNLLKSRSEGPPAEKVVDKLSCSNRDGERRATARYNHRTGM